MNMGELVCCLTAKICHAQGELVNLVNFKFTASSPMFTSSPVCGLLEGVVYAKG